MDIWYKQKYFPNSLKIAYQLAESVDDFVTIKQYLEKPSIYIERRFRNANLETKNKLSKKEGKKEVRKKQLVNNMIEVKTLELKEELKEDTKVDNKKEKVKEAAKNETA